MDESNFVQTATMNFVEGTINESRKQSKATSTEYLWDSRAATVMKDSHPPSDSKDLEPNSKSSQTSF